MIRAYVDRDPLSFSDRIAIIDHREDTHGSNAYMMRLGGDNSFDWERIPPGAIVEPTLKIPDFAAQALLDALAARYEGSADARLQRTDYLAERGRVDKLLDALTKTAATLATGAANRA